MTANARHSVVVRRRTSVARRLLSHRFDDHALRTLPIPITEEDPLPGPQVDTAGRYRYDHLVANRDRAKMRGGVVFPRSAIVPVSLRVPRGDGPLQPLENVLPKAGLMVVHED